MEQENDYFKSIFRILIQFQTTLQNKTCGFGNLQYIKCFTTHIMAMLLKTVDNIQKKPGVW